jgi:glucokinase
VSSAPILGIDVGGTKVESALVDATGSVLTFHRHPTNADRGAYRVIDDIVECVRGCLSQASSRAAAAGVGVAGQVDTETGVVRSAPSLGWREVPLQAHLEKALDLPVAVANDVRATTRGVWRHGAGRGADDLAVIFVGTGIGGGIVSDGQVLEGAHGLAGEVGHMVLMPYGRACQCRNRGCWEAYAGGWAIGERARQAVRTDPEAGQPLVERAGDLDSATARTVHEAHREGDPLAARIVDATAEYLGIGLASVVNAVNPERVVLGGGVIEGHPPYVDHARQIVQKRALEAATDALEVVTSELGDRAGTVGAATTARRHHGEQDRLSRRPDLFFVARLADALRRPTLRHRGRPVWTRRPSEIGGTEPRRDP